MHSAECCQVKHAGGVRTEKARRERAY